jgi:phosphoserine phosphatase
MSVGPPTLAETLAHLEELVAALDRRLPQVERCGEADIAEAAALLRNAAVQRIEEVRRAITDRTPDGARSATQS